MRNQRLKYIWLVAIVFLQTTLWAQEEGEIRKIRFTGNHHYSSKELQSRISFTPATWLGKKLFKKNPSYFSTDGFEMNKRELVHFYQTEGFLSVRVEQPIIKVRGRKKKIELKIPVIEGEPILIDSVKLRFANNETFQQLITAHQTGKLGLLAHPAQRFRDDLVWNDRDQISRFLINRGYPYASATPEITTDTINKTANIIWDINRGPLGYFGPITVTGNIRTPEKLILRQLAFKEGDVYSREKLNRSQQQVYQLGTFRVASLRAQLTRQQSDTIPVNIVINEAPRTSTRVGVGYGREDQIRGFIDFQILNFTGGARRLNLFLKHSALEPYRIEATLTQPAAFSPNSTLALSPSIRKLKEPGYELLTYGVNLSLLQKITSKTSGSFNIYYDKVNLDTTSLARIAESTLLAKSYSKSGIAAGVIFDDASPRFDPSKGWSIAVNTKMNSMAFTGKYPFLKYLLEVKNYQRATPGIILASKIKIGAIQPMKGTLIVPVEERYFAGGSRSVRGWARQELGPKDSFGVPMGGNSLLEASIEPRIKIVGPLSLIVFLDAGNVWPTANTFNLSDIHFSAGSGLRFATPIGPVGIDFARPVFETEHKWQFHINIGHAF